MTTPETTAPETPPATATYEVAIVGAGYVGVPLAQVFAEAGRRVVLVDIDEQRVERLRRGESYIEDVSSRRWRSSWQTAGSAPRPTTTCSAMSTRS